MNHISAIILQHVGPLLPLSLVQNSTQQIFRPACTDGPPYSVFTVKKQPTVSKKIRNKVARGQSSGGWCLAPKPAESEANRVLPPLGAVGVQTRVTGLSAARLAPTALLVQFVNESGMHFQVINSLLSAVTYFSRIWSTVLISTQYFQIFTVILWRHGLFFLYAAPIIWGAIRACRSHGAVQVFCQRAARDRGAVARQHNTTAPRVMCRVCDLGSLQNSISLLHDESTA